MTQIVEPEVSNMCSLEQMFKTPFQSLSSTLATPGRRKDSIFTDDRGIPSNLFGQLRRHRHAARTQPRSLCMCTRCKLFFTKEQNKRTASSNTDEQASRHPDGLLVPPREAVIVDRF